MTLKDFLQITCLKVSRALSLWYTPLWMGTCVLKPQTRPWAWSLPATLFTQGLREVIWLYWISIFSNKTCSNNSPFTNKKKRLNLGFYFYFYLLCVCVFKHTFLYICVPWVLMPSEPELALNFVELKFQVVVNHLVGAGHWTQVFCKNSKGS